MFPTATSRRRLGSALVLSAFLGLGFAACGSDDDGGSIETPTTAASGDEAPADVDTITEGKLTVCSDIPYAPFEYEEDGEVVGIDIDLVKAVAEDLGLEAEIKDTDFDGIFAALKAGQCDMIASSVSITEERKQENNFSTGYFAINQSLLVRKADEATLKDEAALKGKTVGVQSETTGAAFAAELAETAGFEVKEFTGADELFTALKAEQIDGIIQDFPINSYNAETTGETAVTKTFDAEEREEYGFVIPKESTALLEAVNASLAEMQENGEYDSIITKYLGEGAATS